MGAGPRGAWCKDTLGEAPANRHCGLESCPQPRLCAGSGPRCAAGSEGVCGLRTQVCSGVVHAGERAAPRTEAQCLGVQGAGGRQTKPSSAVLIRQHLTDLGTFVQPPKSSVSENLGCVTNTAYR